MVMVVRQVWRLIVFADHAGHGASVTLNIALDSDGSRHGANRADVAIDFDGVNKAEVIAVIVGSYDFAVDNHLAILNDYAATREGTSEDLFA